MNPIMIERLSFYAKAARECKHGDKGRIYEVACRELGISRATFLRKLKDISITDKRKQRSDAGNTSLQRIEANLISATLLESTRKNGKRLYSVGDAVETLRANNMIIAGRIDKNSGEVIPLSTTSIVRALRYYGLHPDQLMSPSPVTELASLHPNHVWQIDASLCTLYYLSNGQRGLQVMESEKFYKNKPANIARINSNRVWSYEITDHCSGWIYVEYVMGGESGENLCSVLINAMQERNGADVLHGIPHLLYLDPGSANTAGMTKNLCRSLGIKLLTHKVHNARATGQVEKARDIIERKFEPGLKFQPVADLDELNEKARAWRAYFNATAVHSRHGKNRTEIWMRITPQQLIKAPSVAICRKLAVSTPESRKISPKLRISFHGNEYDVSHIPGVMVGEKLWITRNPWSHEMAQVALIDQEGNEILYSIGRISKNEFGFSNDATIIGKGYKSHAETRAQIALKEIESLVMQEETVKGIIFSRKLKKLPFGSKFDPYRHINKAMLPDYMPREGTPSEVNVITAPSQKLTHVEAATVLKRKIEVMGEVWSPDYFQFLINKFPSGCDFEELDNIVHEIIQLPYQIVHHIK